MLRRSFFVRLVAATAVACVWVTPARAVEPIEVHPVEHESPAGPVRGYLVKVNLSADGLETVVTVPSDRADASRGIEADLEPTDRWAQRMGLVLAINANYYAALGGSLADIQGLAVSDRAVVSPPRQFEGAWDPALIFRGDGSATVGLVADSELHGVVDGVAGIGASPSDRERGGLLVDDGINRGAAARVEPQQRHPRTAAGVTADGMTLILAVIDGRQPEWSVGVTLQELADVLIAAGAYDAVNLDGGGSTSLYFVDAAGNVVTNRPSDKDGFRPVANHLGFRLQASASDASPPAMEGRPSHAQP